MCQRFEVGLDVAIFERQLADAGVDDAVLLDPEFNLAALGVLYGLFHIRRDRAQLGVWHQALGPQNLTQTAHNAHHVGCCDDAVIIQIACLHIFHQVFSANLVSASCGCLVGIVALGKYGNLDVFARA